MKHDEQIRSLLLGFAAVTCAFIGESATVPGLPSAEVSTALNVVVGAIGLLLAVPALARLLAHGQFSGASLTALGVPLATLFAYGLIYSTLCGRSPTAVLVALGVGGIALALLGVHRFRRADPAPMVAERMGLRPRSPRHTVSLTALMEPFHDRRNGATS